MILAAAAEPDRCQWLMPAAVITASIITIVGQFFIKRYELRAQAKLPAPQKKKRLGTVLFWSEIIFPLLLLGISIWRLVALLSGGSPPSRMDAFAISAFTGVSFLSAVFLFIRIILYVAARRVWRENPDLSKS